MDLNLVYRILLGVGVFVALIFTLLVFLTGKGDAMSGGSGVRTSFKGKSSFEDKISTITFIAGGSFMFLMLVLDYLSHQMNK